jgi:hypothetical protein
VVLLGFEVGREEEMRKTRLDVSDRRFALDALVDLVRKPRSDALTSALITGAADGREGGGGV